MGTAKAPILSTFECPKLYITYRSSLVKLLIEHGADIKLKDSNCKTPIDYAVQNTNGLLHEAHLAGQESLQALVIHFGSALKEFEYYQCLILAIKEGRSEFVYILLKGYTADLNSIPQNGDELLLVTAVKYGQCNIVKSFVSDFGCDVNVKVRKGRSLLHLVADVEMLKLLVNEFGMSLLLVDEDGNTPLHVCAELNRSECVHSLLYDFHSPVYARNRAGDTPRDVSSDSSVQKIIEDFISVHKGRLEADYKSMQRLAASRYSGSHCISRLFVVGHPGAGKSSLVETLKREGFIKSFSRVSDKSVPLHTAGIVPSIHTSDNYGRVQFYDFAGDPEYYSSHAAILEKLFLSDVGNNICIIVLNLKEDAAEIEKKYLYWQTFINHNTKNLEHTPSVLVTGSHADLLPKLELEKKDGNIKSLLRKFNQQCIYLSLNCCQPRSENIKHLRQQIQVISKNHEPYRLSYEASVLLGLLENDFSNVIACTAKTIVSHLEQVNFLRLPRSFSGLYPFLKQLQAIGSLLILGSKEEDSYLVLNVSRLTNEVHKKMFSEDAFSGMPDMASFNIGLLPHSLVKEVLKEVLPSDFTKECLVQLQYCQEIAHVEIGQDYSISLSSKVGTSPDKSFLFFPALCKLDKSSVLWLLPLEGSYSLGWLARCTNPHDYFPPIGSCTYFC